MRLHSSRAAPVVFDADEVRVPAGLDPVAAAWIGTVGFIAAG